MKAPLSESAYICQIGFVVRDAAATAKAYAEFFHLPVPGTVWTDTRDLTDMRYRGLPSDGRAKLAFLQLGDLQLEFIEPDDGRSGWKDFLQGTGERFHHFAVKVTGMKEKLAELEAWGLPVLQQGEFTGGRYACLDSEAEFKTVLELLEEDGRPLPVWNGGTRETSLREANALGTTRIVHLGFLVRDAAATVNRYSRLFGVKPTSFVTDAFDKAHTVLRGREVSGRASIHLLDMGPIQLEFIEPDAGDSLWREDLDRLGEGFHHLALDAADIAGKLPSLASMGIPLTQSGDFDGGRYVYLDAKDPLKTNLELLERWEVD